jgi:hypothetical protein
VSASESPAAPPRDILEIEMPEGTAQHGKGFFGWLGRQVGYVKKAVQTDVEKPALAPAPPEQVLYKNATIEETSDPRNPNVKLRRTIIDEALQSHETPTNSEPS